MPSRRRLTTTLLMSVAQLHAARQDRKQGAEATRAAGAERGACMEAPHLGTAWRLRPAARHSSRLVPWTTFPCILRQAPRPHGLRDRQWSWRRSACNVARDVARRPRSRRPPARHVPVARSRVAPPIELEGSMISRMVALASLLLVVASCAGVAEQHSESANPSAGSGQRARGAEPEDPDAMLICVMERPTGSNIAERVCRRATEGEKRRMRTQDSLTVPRASPVPRAPGSSR